MSVSDRSLIARLARDAHGGLITVSAAAEILDIDRREAATKLAALTRKGWLLRARRGMYSLLPLEAEPGRPTVSEDPWILAREAFSPAYIGGWSAAEHWGLTEQLFRSTLVVTAAHVRVQTVILLGHEFRLFQVPKTRISGTTLVWRGRERIPVSTPERTLVDCLRNPELCGGIRHLAQMFVQYGEKPENNFEALMVAASKNSTGAMWKRLGYLTEQLWPAQTALIREAAQRMTTGYAKLDPTIPGRGKLLRRWRLWINATITNEASRV